jgi:tetratricopeptide (TPR) repeat protein
LAFLVFIILAGFCFGVIHTINYIIAEQHAQKWRENSKLLKQVTALFGQEKFNEAFSMINLLRDQDPLEFRFGFTRDSLIMELRNMADKRMAYQDFIGAVEYYQVLRNYEHPPSLETLNKIASCQYYLGNYSESLVAMKHLHNQQPWNLELIYQIGMINLEKLDNKMEALHYFSMGKKLFKDNLTKVYGEAFEIIMDPTDAPDVYFDIFEARARTNIRLKDFKEAATDCNWAVFLRPNKHEPYRLRAICKIELRNYGEACVDLRKATFHGSQSVSELSRRFCR